MLNCLRRLVTYVDSKTEQVVPGICDTLLPIIGDPHSLSTLLGHKDVIPTAKRLDDAVEALRAELQRLDIPKEVEDDLKEKYVFRRQNAELTRAESVLTWKPSVESAADLDPFDFQAKDSRFGRLIQHILTGRQFFQLIREMDTWTWKRDPRRLALLNSDDFTMSLFTRPDSSIITTSLCFKMRAQMIFGTRLSYLSVRAGDTIRKNLKLDHHGYMLTTQCNTREGHRTPMHNAFQNELAQLIREAGLRTVRGDRIFTEGLSTQQVQQLHNDQTEAGGRIQPDLVVDWGQDHPNLARRPDIADTRIVYDIKTMGFSATYQEDTNRATKPCAAIDKRGKKVAREYLNKAKQLDSRLTLPENTRKGPVEARMEQLTEVKGLAIGPLCEVSSHVRELLKPLVERIAMKRGKQMVINNCTQGQIESMVYDSIRRRIGLLMHTLWFELMIRSMSLVGWGTRQTPDDFDVIEASREISEQDIGALAVDGELGV